MFCVQSNLLIYCDNLDRNILISLNIDADGRRPRVSNQALAFHKRSYSTHCLILCPRVGQTSCVETHSCRSRPVHPSEFRWRGLTFVMTSYSVRWPTQIHPGPPGTGVPPTRVPSWIGQRLVAIVTSIWRGCLPPTDGRWRSLERKYFRWNQIWWKNITAKHVYELE